MKKHKRSKKTNQSFTEGLLPMRVIMGTKEGGATLAALAPIVNKRLYLKSFSDFDVIGYKPVDNLDKLAEVEKTYLPAWEKYKKERNKYDKLEPYEKAAIPEEDKPHPPIHPLEQHLVYFNYDEKYLIFCDKLTEGDAITFHQWKPKEYAEDDVGRVARVTVPISDTAPLTEKDVVQTLESRLSMSGPSPEKVEGSTWRGNQQIRTIVNAEVRDAAKGILSPQEMDEMYELEHSLDNAQVDLPLHQQKYGIPMFMYAANATFKKMIDGIVKKIGDRQKGPSDGRMTFNDVYSTDLSTYLITQDFAHQYEALARKVQAEVDAILNLKPEDCPKIPHVNPKFKLMPHQAQTLAMLDRMETGLVAIATGGGKTGVLTLDIINLLSKGKIHRPIVLMPTMGGKLVAQQKKEIERTVTDGMINVIGITSQSFARMGTSPEDRYKTLEKLINDSPINTIILCTYDWVRGSRQENKVLRSIMGLNKKGVSHDYERVYWLMTQCHIDYVALDESHKIRNSGTGISEAAMSFTSVPYRRIATGTIIDNNPADLHQQVSFLDPMIFGDRDKFLSDYASAVQAGVRGKKSQAVSWRKEAPQELKQKLIENGASIVDRSHWLHMLPKVVGPTVHVAHMSPAQLSVYREIFEEALKDLEREANEQEEDPNNPGQMRWKNKQLHDAWEKLQNSSTPDDEDLEEDNKAYEHILGKLSVIDSFLNSPLYRPPSEDKHGNMDMEPSWKVSNPKDPNRKIKVDQILKGDDRKSAKCKVIDDILDKHFADKSNGKVLILSHNKNSVMHLASNIKRHAQADWYASGRSAVIEKFLDPDSDLKIMVATDKSVEVGLNLQYVGNRIIRCGVVWNPGSMDQGFARMWRPGSTIPGKITQFDKLYIDFVLAENSIDFTKYARFVWKENYARQINSGFKTDSEFPPIVMNMSFITGFNTHAQTIPYHDHYMTMFEQEKQANEEHRKVYGDKLYPIRSDEKIKGERKIKTPTMPGEDEDDSITILVTVKKTGKGIWMEFESTEDVPDRTLLRHKWKYDKKREVWFQIVQGDGAVRRAVKDLEEEEFIVHINDSRHTEEELKEKAQKKDKDIEDVREEETEKAERRDADEDHIVKLELYASDEEDGTRRMYLRIPRTEDDMEALGDLKFKYHLRWFYYFIRSKSDAIRILDKIHSKKIHITNAEELEDAIRRQKFQTSKLKTGPGKVELLSRVPRKKARGEVTIYLDWRNAKPVLTYSEKESSADISVLRSLGFKIFDPPMYWKSFKSQGELLIILKKMRDEGIRASNWDDFLAGLRKWKLKVPDSLDLSPGDDDEDVDESKVRPER